MLAYSCLIVLAVLLYILPGMRTCGDLGQGEESVTGTLYSNPIVSKLATVMGDVGPASLPESVPSTDTPIVE